MHTFAHHQHGEHGAPETQGRVLNYGWRYDLGTWLLDTFLLRGKLREMRQKALDLARLQPGDKALDVGCGTGTLALEAQQRVGATGSVAGVDPGTQQIARARAKAAKRHLPVDFRTGVIEHLPFPDQSFDAVFSTLMMHHLPDELKRQGLAEIARVLKPGGRLVIADFKSTDTHSSEAVRHGVGASGFQHLIELIQDAGLADVQTQDIHLPRFAQHSEAGFVVGKKPVS